MSLEGGKRQKETVESSDKKRMVAQAALQAAIVAFTLAQGPGDGAGDLAGRRYASELVKGVKKDEEVVRPNASDTNTEAADSRNVHKTPEGIRYTTE